MRLIENFVNSWPFYRLTAKQRFTVENSIACSRPRPDVGAAMDLKTTPEALTELSHSPDPWVRFHVANNPSTDVRTREHLDADEVVERIQKLYGNGRVARALREGTWPWSLPGDFDGFGDSI
ncbi:MAG: hypothetical protein ACYCZN_09720 [Candidatus Dormibacteria bacterium]